MSDPKVVAFPGEATVRPCPTELLVAATEACLFALSGVVTVETLATTLGNSPERVRGALAAIEARLEASGSGIRLVAVGEGFQFRTDPRLASWVAAARGGKPQRLSKAANEALAIIAFRQPVTKGVLDDIRGVDSGGVIKFLSERGLIRTEGRSSEPGRALNWITTPVFLELFGLKSLADLPTLKDLRQHGDDPPEIPLEELEALARNLRPGPRLVED